MRISSGVGVTAAKAAADVQTDQNLPGQFITQPMFPAPQHDGGPLHDTDHYHALPQDILRHLYPQRPRHPPPEPPHHPKAHPNPLPALQNRHHSLA